MSAAHDRDRLPQLDLNLLLTFEVIYRERNLTRAAERLYVSQSAVSHALARLRAQTRDRLFVRQGQGVVPTLVAERLAGPVQEALGLLRRALQGAEFDPARDLGRVTLAMSELLEPLLLPALVGRLRARAPEVELSSIRLERARLERDLASGRLDLAIDVAQPTGPELLHQPLVRDPFCVVSRRRRQLDGAAYLAARHVTVSSRRSGPSLEDILLSQRGHQRRVALRCQHYEAACRVVAGSDLLLTMPRLHARAVNAHLGNVLLPMPLELPPAELHVYWHRLANDDPRSRWLRAQVLAGAHT